MSDLPRGIRNNNPGNLEGVTAWQGRKGMDGPYIVFADPIMGIRALAIDLYNKNVKDGLKTINAIVSKYAPPNENDTAAYEVAVAKTLVMPQTEELDLRHRLPVFNFVRAIIAHENGPAPDGWHTGNKEWFSHAQIDTAMHLAGLWS